MERTDLSLLTLPTPQGFPDIPLYAVGWLGALERPSRAPNRVNSRLIEVWLAKHYMPGPPGKPHLCHLCPPRPVHRSWYSLRIGKTRKQIEGRGYFLISYSRLAYAAPVLIMHYIQEHQYHPPMQFVEAVLKGQFHHYAGVAEIPRAG